MKRILSLTGILLILILLLFLVLSFSQNKTSPISPIWHLHSKDIPLIVVDTPATLELGLGGRESLAEDTAMIFVFDKPGRHEFWMKDMKFSIDIIWLDANFQIVHIESAVSPNTYPDTIFMPTIDSLYVLEVNAHFGEKNGLNVGDKLNIDLKK